MLHWFTTFLIQKVIKIAPLVQKLELHWEASTFRLQSRLVNIYLYCSLNFEIMCGGETNLWDSWVLVY